ncbi:MAG: ABC transporter substrate-binding protein [Anaerolineae bacterium]|nr:ABC transporter substrate-binding protein [Anaerolineae bacterium]
MPLKKPLRIARTLWAGLFPLYLMEKLNAIPEGFEILDLDEYDETLDWLASGKIDGNFNSLADTLFLVGRGASLKLIMPSDLSVGVDGFVSRPELSGVFGLVGKRIGISILTYPHVLILQILAKYHLSENDVELVPVRGEKVVEAVLGGEIDAGHTWGVHIEEATYQGLKLLFTSSEYPGLLVDSLVVHSKSLTEGMERWEAFVTAHDWTIEWWQKNPQKGVDLLAEITGFPPSKISSMMEGVTLYTRQTANPLFDKMADSPPALFASGRLFNRFFIEKGVLSDSVNLEEILQPI